MKEYNMRGTYEAYILVEVKDGRQYVCALNKPKKTEAKPGQADERERISDWEYKVLWN